MMTLHTSANCNVDGDQSGTWISHDCSPATPNNAGCGVQSNTDNSFGTAFNNNRGGVYATLWNSNGIKIWFFPRDKIPKDITRGDPKPETWGKPEANFGGSCNFDSHFMKHWIVSHTYPLRRGLSGTGLRMKFRLPNLLPMLEILHI
jgi:hypothetical protein